MSELELLQEKLRPAVWGHGCGPIMQISQAPGRKVHESGIPFSDVSGEKLGHEWYEIEDDQFYDPDIFGRDISFERLVMENHREFERVHSQGVVRSLVFFIFSGKVMTKVTIKNRVFLR